MDLWRMALDLATEARDDIDKNGRLDDARSETGNRRIYATLAVTQELAGDEPAQ
jgi:hypothetical protein